MLMILYPVFSLVYKLCHFKYSDKTRNMKMNFATTILMTLSVISLIWNANGFCPAEGFFDKTSGACFWKKESLMNVPVCYDYCLNRGGRLAEITNSITYSNILTHMPITACLWIAVTDCVDESNFKTFSGETQTFLPWNVGQPDSSFYSGEDCVYMANTSSPVGLWNDGSCLYKTCHCLCFNKTYDTIYYEKCFSRQSSLIVGSINVAKVETIPEVKRPQCYFIRKTDNPCDIVNSTVTANDQSLLDCAELCSSKANCGAFSYQENVLKCYLHPDEFCLNSNSDYVVSYIKRF